MNIKEKKNNKNKNEANNQNRTESEKWTSHRGSSVGRGKGGIGGKRYREEEA